MKLTPVQSRILSRSTDEWTDGGCIGLTKEFMDDPLLEHRRNPDSNGFWLQHRLTDRGREFLSRA